MVQSLDEWDETKNRLNQRRHGIDFADAMDVFNRPMLVALDDREDYGEDRWIGIGLMGHRVVVVVYTERGDRIRLISARKAKKHEAQRYEQAVKD